MEGRHGFLRMSKSKFQIARFYRIPKSHDTKVSGLVYECLESHEQFATLKHVDAGVVISMVPQTLAEVMDEVIKTSQGWKVKK